MEEVPPEASLVGHVVEGKYRVEELIARGDRALVFRAEQVPLGRTVAIKVLRPAPSDSDARSDPGSFQKRFFLEASTLSRLQHPNVVAMFDYGRTTVMGRDAYFIAMEYIAGETLAQALAKRRLEPLAAIGVLRQIARGLRAAHGLKVIHRDLKPSNVMLTPGDPEPLVKVVDFGIVKVLSDDPEQLTRAGTMLGTPEYMPPEQIEGRAVDARSDVYAFGTIFYEVLTGRTPFVGAAPDVLSDQLRKLAPAMSVTSPGLQIPPEVERFVMRCLEKSPDDRPADMDEVLSALASCEGALEAQQAPLSRRSVAASAPPAARSEPRLSRQRPRSAPPPDRLALAAWMLFAVGMLVLAIGLVRYFA